MSRKYKQYTSGQIENLKLLYSMQQQLPANAGEPSSLYFEDPEYLLQQMLSPAQRAQAAERIASYEKEFLAQHKLDSTDIAIAIAGGVIGAIIDLLLVGIPARSRNGLEAGFLSNYIRQKMEVLLPAEEMAELANSSISKVPFDAQDNRNTTIPVEGLSTYYHRLLSLGHDPILGFFFGVMDILNGTMTTISKDGKFVCQKMEHYSDRTETTIFAAFAKEFHHLCSDVTTSMGLPAPFLGLANLCQFGSIGEYDQTVAEIAQGMYYEGFDSIHFLAQSASQKAVELVIRLLYGIKRVREGHSIIESIPISTSRIRCPKLETMLFIGHSVAVAANAEKVFVSKKPVAINEAQWFAFIGYTIKQIDWVTFGKAQAKTDYLNHKSDERRYDLMLQLGITPTAS